MAQVSKSWAIAYCERLMLTYALQFPFQIGRQKSWGGIDAISTITDAESFYRCYSEFNEHPRCTAIFITSTDKLISI